jgi:putrescine transport system permease protein
MSAVTRANRWAIGIPYLWLALFFLVPFAIVVRISLAEARIAIPPYTDLLQWVDGRLRLTPTLDNFAFIFTDRLYALAYLNSVWIALVSTFVCLLISYPMAWVLARSRPAVRNILLLLIVVPSWTSFLIRVYAWIGILSGNGYLNNALLALGLIDEPLTLLHTNFAVYLGIVYSYLPFMVLPLYTSLVKLDYSLVEAALDLGASPARCFWSVVLPLSRAGIIAGCLLVFIPATGEFVIPELLGGADTLMIGKVLWQEFFNNRDWPIASAVAILLVLLLLAPILVFYHYQFPAEEPPRPGEARA